jgi:hypothetical protein
MSRPRLRHGLYLGLLASAVAVAVAPAPPGKEPGPSPLSQARYQAALKQFGEVWAYYRQSRTDSFQTYYWSRLVLDSQRELGGSKAERVAALEAHLGRMRRLEALVKKVRKIGFGFSTDVGASEYYRLEAEAWLETARAG